ncbi:SPJ_0845 family protein [Lactococcus nasutitermitis]|uniref:SPJ_0845 family protein n=1 Tax=Lactococcus nasutitermitis TaxID=1652957 RepID=A0ABV9JAC3_9LACT|nr:SPJ_0845 family protein [Lactococcus nasutitermitis]
MGLTFKKRDDFDELMDGLGVSTVDLVTNDDDKDKGDGKKKDPFAKFLAPETDKNSTDKAKADKQ